MITIHLFILTALALFGAYLAYRFRQPAIYLILACCLFIGASGLWAEGLSPSPSDLCLNNTSEDSLYYPCNHTTIEYEDPFCYGTPDQDSCALYDVDQCQGVPSCTWLIDACTGAPDNCTVVGDYDPTGFKCAIETPGCYWNLGTPTETTVNATCDSVNVTYHYGVCISESNGDPANGWLWSGIFLLLGLALLGGFIAELLPKGDITP